MLSGSLVAGIFPLALTGARSEVAVHQEMRQFTEANRNSLRTKTGIPQTKNQTGQAFQIKDVKKIVRCNK
jgi:hypothetical protein